MKTRVTQSLDSVNKAWASLFAHTLLTEYSFGCKSSLANRMVLDVTTLHYLAVRRAIVSVQDLYIQKSR